MGFLLAIFAGIFPRLALFIYWIARPAKVDAAFDTFLLPFLGIIFLPFATLIYALLYTPGVALTGWEWFWIVVAAILDIGHWGVGVSQRNQIPGRRASTSRSI
jgi:hypothetical protein